MFYQYLCATHQCTCSCIKFPKFAIPLYVAAGSQDALVLEELSKTNNVLQQLVGDMKKTIHRVGVLEDKIFTSGNSSSTSNTAPPSKTPQKRTIPPAVRVSTIYVCI